MESSTSVSPRVQVDRRKVYLIQDQSGRVKIGCSDNPETRLAQLQTASPEKLTLLATCHGGEAFEKRLHARYMQCRLKGEWFEFPDAVVTEYLVEMFSTLSTFTDVDWGTFPEWKYAGHTVIAASITRFGVKVTCSLLSVYDAAAYRGLTRETIVNLINRCTSIRHLHVVMNTYLLPFDDFGCADE